MLEINVEERSVEEGSGVESGGMSGGEWRENGVGRETNAMREQEIGDVWHKGKASVVEGPSCALQ